MLVKFIVVFFIFFLFLFNWSDFSWVFSPRALPQGLQGLVEKKGEVTEEEDSVSIPKINVMAPVVLPINDDFDEALNRGVTFFTGSVLPGENGTTILLGHSAPPNWPDIRYDGVFNDLDKLEKNDDIYVAFSYRRYTYGVEDIIYVQQGEEIPALTTDKNMIALVSCWPPGQNKQRIVVRGLLR